MELAPPYSDGSESPTPSKRRKGTSPCPSLGASTATASTSLVRNAAPQRRPSPQYSQPQSYHYGPQSHQPYLQQSQQYSSNYPHSNQQQQQWQQQQQHSSTPSSRHAQRDMGIFRSQQSHPQPQEHSMYSSVEPWTSNNTPDSKSVFPIAGGPPSTSLHHSRHPPWSSSGQQPQHGMPQQQQQPEQQQQQQQQQQWFEFSSQYYEGPPQSVADADQEEKGNHQNHNNMMKGRGKYVCGKCGAPKKGHVCPYQPKLKRRADEPPPEMKNAAVQVEMDELMVIRRLNLEIQGFPESYLAGPLELLQDNVYSEPYEGSLFSSSTPLFPSSTDVVSSRNSNNNIPSSPP